MRGIRALALGHRPLWAVASTEALANLQLPAGVEVLTILISTATATRCELQRQRSAHWEGTHRVVRIIEMSQAGGAS